MADFLDSLREIKKELDKEKPAPKPVKKPKANPNRDEFKDIFKDDEEEILAQNGENLEQKKARLQDEFERYAELANIKKIKK